MGQLQKLHIQEMQDGRHVQERLTGPATIPADQGHARQWAPFKTAWPGQLLLEVWRGLGSHERAVWQFPAAASLCTLQGW